MSLTDKLCADPLMHTTLYTVWQVCLRRNITFAPPLLDGRRFLMLGAPLEVGIDIYCILLYLH
jgi:hypothetical protein